MEEPRWTLHWDLRWTNLGSCDWSGHTVSDPKTPIRQRFLNPRPIPEEAGESRTRGRKNKKEKSLVAMGWEPSTGAREPRLSMWSRGFDNPGIQRPRSLDRTSNQLWHLWQLLQLSPCHSISITWSGGFGVSVLERCHNTEYLGYISTMGTRFIATIGNRKNKM